MKVLVLYNSRGGNTRTAAENIASVARHLGYNVKVKSVIEVMNTDIDEADLLFVGTWIQGFILFGVKPAGASSWTKALPSIAGKPVGIFCTYAVNPRNSLNKLAEYLTDQGAIVLDEMAFQRDHTDEGVLQFVENVIQSARSVAV